MPRLAGQIDVAKNEAILDAAVDVLTERGAFTSIEEVARRAGVSKQTVYNHYGSKAELVRAICARRVHQLSAPLEAAGALERPEETLAAYARALLRGLLVPRSVAMMRTAIANAAEMPELAMAFFEAGPMGNRRRLAAFLSAETAAGRLACPDPMAASEAFSGLVISPRQITALFGALEPLSEPEIDRIARDAARQFVKLFGV